MVQVLDLHHQQQKIICDDLLVEIFLRLPVESVFRLKCLSNKWNHLFSNRHFRNEYESVHRKKSKNTLQPLLGFFRSFRSDLNLAPCSTCFIPTCIESMVIRSKQFAYEPGYSFNVSNSVLLCVVCVDGATDYYVCNPFTDHWFKLPHPPNTGFSDMFGGVSGFIYEEDDQDNGFSFTVVRVDSSCHPKGDYTLMEIETYNYCSSSGSNSVVDNEFWDKYVLRGAVKFVLSGSFGCQVVGSTFFWIALTLNNGYVLVAYNYNKLQSIRDQHDADDDDEGTKWVWLIEFHGTHHTGRPILGECSTSTTDCEGRLLCVINTDQFIEIYKLKSKLECYSYSTVVPLSEWVQTAKLIITSIATSELSPVPYVIAIHPQNSRLVLMKSGTTIYWYDVESGDSRSIWVLGLPLWNDDFERFLPIYQPQCWPPLL